MHQVNSSADISPPEVHNGLLQLLGLPAGPTRDVMLGSVLTGLLLRGPRPAEVEAAIRAASTLDRRSWESLTPPSGVRLVGYTGSGKKTYKTINLSSAAALVAAAGGAHIAKLGSRSASSRTGSRDFMDVVGARCETVPAQAMVDIAGECGFGFFSIENRVPEFDRRYGGRFQAVHALSLGFPALLSPVACQGFVYGLSHPAVGVSARLLYRLGLGDVTVVNSSPVPGSQVDELIPGGTIRVCRLTAGQEDPEFGRAVAKAAGAVAPLVDLGSLAQRTDPRANVAAVVRLLASRAPAVARRTVALNAAVLMLTARAVPTLWAGLDTAHAVLDDGAALDTLRRFVSLTGGAPRTVDALLRLPGDHRATSTVSAPRRSPQNVPAFGRLAVPSSGRETTAC
ncbi:hypothetical protein [Kitasatospora sp. MAP5-34]|uniref:hypothetical protein n=1 Tax=Kitasatospora sp. MAP5-34 TaxID=3035102 RepID=UPI00247643C7|nr:hypothetical protein [Kitasatospora sp. MAP5-34]